MKTVEVKRTLVCKLNNEELLAYSKELSSALSEKTRQEGILESFKSQVKAKIQEQEAKINLLSEKVYSEKEYREIDCEWRYDFADGFKHLWRKDTGDQVDVSKIEESEKQMQLGEEDSK